MVGSEDTFYDEAKITQVSLMYEESSMPAARKVRIELLEISHGRHNCLPRGVIDGSSTASSARGDLQWVGPLAPTYMLKGTVPLARLLARAYPQSPSRHTTIGGI
ncbi:hypothetical protein FHL15_005729 [Xylaria flabelliformis]|uniref:Uncharacterized protein n=1 Tax=Xylaria flabelliformis TaxID=2512241 RepID=A0A553HZS1_9PEZI|nr:hypothetical protein FHL15_005729 [Xylaria flabelliformis]